MPWNGPGRYCGGNGRGERARARLQPALADTPKRGGRDAGGSAHAWVSSSPRGELRRF